MGLARSTSPTAWERPTLLLKGKYILVLYHCTSILAKILEQWYNTNIYFPFNTFPSPGAAPNRLIPVTNRIPE
jgi:hypothetical protein